VDAALSKRETVSTVPHDLPSALDVISAMSITALEKAVGKFGIDEADAYQDTIRAVLNLLNQHLRSARAELRTGRRKGGECS
jgi:plasmid stabilization system protein ParE